MKVALSVLLTKYNAVGVPCTEPISMTCQLNKRCKLLFHPLLYKDARYAEPYREVMRKNKQNKEELGGPEF